LKKTNKILYQYLSLSILLTYQRCQPNPTVVGKLSILAFMAKVANKSNCGQTDQNYHHW